VNDAGLRDEGVVRGFFVSISCLLLVVNVAGLRDEGGLRAGCECCRIEG
jgi:hypothetical protein